VRETEGNPALGDSIEKLDIFAGGKKLEAVWHRSIQKNVPTIVMLHEGLGSVSAWRDWPAELARETGFDVFVYSRAGYGNSDPVTLPRPLTYMHHEADDVLPEVLAQTKIQKCILLGHSDGASISILHVGGKSRSESILGIVLLSPHVFCEDLSVTSIEKSRDAYVNGDLKSRLTKYHRDVDNAFWGWNGVWLDPEFRNWNIEDRLPKIDLPTLVIQEDNDPYGTLAQVDAIEHSVTGSKDILVLKGNGHFPQKDCHDETTRAVVDFARAALG
jgi:pimeloyl-ACP methyl ester carboxylesterase